jgi:hypothetical protein
MSAAMASRLSLTTQCLRLTRPQIPRIRRPMLTCFATSKNRAFSTSFRLKANTLMETSGFTDTQLQVREAIAKICEDFPDVGSLVLLVTST